MVPDLAQSIAPTAAEAVECAHCRLPVPAGLIDPSHENQFCCNGCRTVYDVIHGCGLETYYRIRDTVDADPLPARPAGHAYEEMDNDVFLDANTAQRSDNHRTVALYLEGVHCAACVWLVERLPRVLPGVLEATLHIRESVVRIAWDPQKVALSRIARMLNSLGYPPHPVRNADRATRRRDEDRRFLIRIAIAGACAGNVMLASFALYGGFFNGMAAEFEALFRWLSAGLGVVSLLWPGAVFFRGAIAAIRTQTAHLDLPIALGLTVGTITGLVNTILQRGEIYFDSLTVLVFLLLVGRWVQHRQQRWASDAVELLFSLTPTAARRIEGDTVRTVPIEALQPNDLVQVRAGDNVPVDGIVTDGTSTIDQALLTGESRPFPIAAGQSIYAGVTNLSSPLTIRAQTAGAQTRVGRLMQLVEEWSQRKAPIVRLADRIAGWFVAAVLLLALLTFVLWMRQDTVRAVDQAIALLIVTCPCALGLATPLAMTVALGRAAQRGILIKGADTLERLARPGLICFDKTGTLTAGRMSVVEWVGDETVRPLTAALEAHSSHPVASALTQLVPDDHQLSLQATAVQETPGAGIRGRVDGRSLLIGSERYLAENGVTLPPTIARAAETLTARALSPVYISQDDVVVAVAGLGDPLRPDTSAALSTLRVGGWDLRLLSGDHRVIVSAIATELEIPADDAVGECTPERKRDWIDGAASAGPVVMVGDGVNDAAALATADVGIAVHGGAEASLAAADVYLRTPGLSAILDLLSAARSTVRAIHVGLAVSLAYNVVAASLAIAGIINPLIAAILMPLSSLTVVAIAFGAQPFGDLPKPAAASGTATGEVQGAPSFRVGDAFRNGVGPPG